MFIENKYTRWYFSIIKNAKNRDICVITERHHVIPKALGGNNDEDNLINLTPREHYICHWLLTKMTQGKNKNKMTFALHTFFHFNNHRKLNFTSKQYEFHKKLFIESCRLRDRYTKKDVFRFRHSITGEEFVGSRHEFHKHSRLSKQDINWLVKYCIDPKDSKKQIKKWGIWIDKLNIFSYDKPRPKPTINLLPDITCENCGKTISNGNYKRWHGNRCKSIDPRGHYERTRQVAGINRN